MQRTVKLVLAISLVTVSAGASTPVAIHPGQEARSPSLISDAKGRLHLAYVAFENDKDVPDIFYTSSADGKKWSKPVDVSKTPGVSAEPQIAVGSAGEIVIVWVDTVPGADQSDVFASSSTNSGKTWSKAINISNTPGKSDEPSIAIAPDGGFHVVWRDTNSDNQQDIWTSRSIDHGKSWSKPVDASNTPGLSATPEVAVGPKGEVAVTWADSDGQGQDIWFGLSSDEGKTWTPARDLSNNPGLSANPSIAIDGKGTIYVAWDDSAAGQDQPDIYLLISRDGGKVFEPSVDVSKTPGPSSNPEITAAADGTVALAWEDTSKDAKAPDILVTTSSDGGKTFAASTNVSSSPGLSSAPDITLVYGTVYAVWEEDDGGKSRLKGASLPVK